MTDEISGTFMGVGKVEPIIFMCKFAPPSPPPLPSYHSRPVPRGTNEDWPTAEACVALQTPFRALTQHPGSGSLAILAPPRGSNEDKPYIVKQPRTRNGRGAGTNQIFPQANPNAEVTGQTTSLQIRPLPANARRQTLSGLRQSRRVLYLGNMGQLTASPNLH